MGAAINNVGHGSQKSTDEMNSLAVSYLGKPLHFLASLLWAMLSRLLAVFIRRSRDADNQATTLTFDKPAPPAPRPPLVRLKNLPQVSGCALLEDAQVRLRSDGAPSFAGSTAACCSSENERVAQWYLVNHQRHHHSAVCPSWGWVASQVERR